MRRLLISASARRDIANALEHSGRLWGAAQRRKYRALIQDALSDLIENPEHPASRARDEIRPSVRTFHIARPGRPARHLIAYRVTSHGDVHVLRLLHDAMELFRALSQGV